MKKQNLKSLKLKKHTISNFNTEEINGGVTGSRCLISYNCTIPETLISCPDLTFLIGCDATSMLC
ncbi:hypothetical protein H2O64_19215 [Kordia sp. YSTF-M3]|uniref:Natural product n=1 Tax=Kordia aestuariivivens TaxID=2759037 RepID=A0ABR7QE00_9FLAO|nr:hypothetical protein [Kordia aestuariivivens]MBC8756812.1 hypothetical protein [Kordia aestuariivivens]